MRSIYAVTLLVGLTVLFQRCDDDETPCETYQLTSEVDVLNKEGGDKTFIYDADGSLKSVLWDDQPGSVDFFYDANGRVIRVEPDNEFTPIIPLLFTYDDHGRVISIHDDAHYVDSTVFEYDNSDRMIKALFYVGNTKKEAFLLNYYEYEYPDAGTVKKNVFLRDQNTKEFGLGYTNTYAMDNHPRPHPKEYYLYLFPIQEVLPNNPLSIHTTYGSGSVTTKSYKYNEGGFPVSEDDKFTYRYDCK